MDNASVALPALVAQSIFLQLQICVKTLDALGANVSAAHVDAAVQSMQKELAEYDLQAPVSRKRLD